MLPMGAAMTLTGVSIAGTLWMHRRTVMKLEERDRLVEILAPVALGFFGSAENRSQEMDDEQRRFLAGQGHHQIP